MVVLTVADGIGVESLCIVFMQDVGGDIGSLVWHRHGGCELDRWQSQIGLGYKCWGPTLRNRKVRGGEGGGLNLRVRIGAEVDFIVASHRCIGMA